MPCRPTDVFLRRVAGLVLGAAVLDDRVPSHSLGWWKHRLVGDPAHQ